MRFSEIIRQVSPRWLATGTAEKILYSMFVACDVLATACAESVKARCPGVLSGESLPIIGRDRLITRGKYETDGLYASRLNRWLTDHATRGGPYAMIAQIRAHFGDLWKMALVYRSGRHFEVFGPGESVSRTDISWTPDGDTAKWAKFWLFYFVSEPIPGDGTWDGPGSYDDGKVWDSDLTVSDAEDYRRVPKNWSPAHTRGEIVLLGPGQDLWDYPESTWTKAGGVGWSDYGPPRIYID